MLPPESCRWSISLTTWICQHWTSTTPNQPLSSSSRNRTTAIGTTAPRFKSRRNGFMVMAWPVWAMHIGIVCECMEFWRFWREGTRGSPWISVWERSIYIDIQISVIINEFVVHAVFWFAPLFFWGPVVFDILVGVSAFKSSISDAAGQGLLWVLRKLIWPCWKLVGEWSPTHMQLTYVNNYVCVIIMCINLYVVYIYIYLSYIYICI